jgi:hypothetical protein
LATSGYQFSQTLVIMGSSENAESIVAGIMAAVSKSPRQNKVVDFRIAGVSPAAKNAGEAPALRFENSPGYCDAVPNLTDGLAGGRLPAGSCRGNSRAKRRRADVAWDTITTATSK